MAATGLLALLDDIATILDDVAAMTKVAAKKTSGVLGDDLALNAQQVAGVAADRELPVVWAVFKGSLLNKAVLVPAALAISTWVPWLVSPLLMLGGAYLCYEGFEKLAHKFFHGSAQDNAHQQELVDALKDPGIDFLVLEKQKIKGAIRTDFILSAEIIAITLGIVATKPFLTQVVVLSSIAVLMTLGVYGLVAGIVKLDDLGLHLSKNNRTIFRKLGESILRLAPWLMKSLSVLGTAAMFLVGGSILTHGIDFLHHQIEVWTGSMGHIIKTIASTAAEGFIGVIAGAIVLSGVMMIQKIFFVPKKSV